jgi:tripartite ATP-independent transporter DctP family solute receptor
MKRRTFTMAIGGFGAASVLAPALTSAAPQLKAASNLPPEHPAAVRSIEMWNDVRRETNGLVDVKSFPNSILGGDPSMIAQLRSGAIDFYLAPGGTLGAVVDVANIEDIGFAYNASADAWRTFDGPLGAYIRKQALTQGIVLFEKMFDGGMRQITSNGKVIKTVDDLQGFKLRVATSRPYIDMFHQFGAQPTSLALSECYVALQTHVVDGAENALALISTQRFYEVQKVLSLTNHGWSGYWLLANGDNWNKIPPAARQSVIHNAAKYALLQRRDNDILNATLVDKMRRIGLAVNRTDPAAFRSHLAPYYAKMRDQFGPAPWALLEASVGKLA